MVLEFCSEEFNAYCRKNGITRHRTIAHTPQQNSVAERMNHTILEKVRCMLSNSKMPKIFWAEASSTACYIINRSPSVALDKKTPIEVNRITGRLQKFEDIWLSGLCMSQ